MGDYTNKLQLSMPSEGGCNWAYDWYRNQFIIDAVAEQELNDNSVSSGCILTDGTGGLSIDISAGIVVVDDVQYDIAAGNHVLVGATVEIEQYNFIYVDDSGTLIVSTLEPTGSFALIGVVDTSTTGVERIADLRREPRNLPIAENEIINGKFDIFQRSSFQTNVSGMKSDDRWFNYYNAGITNGVTHTVNSTTEVDGRNAYHYSRTVINSYTHTSSDVVMKYQKIKGIKRFFGKKLVLGFWARVDGTQDISALFKHRIDGVEQEKTLAQKVSPPSSGFQKFTLFYEIPEYISGTVGELDSLELNFMFSAGSNLDAESASLGSQDGIFDLSNVEVYISDIELSVRQRTPEDELQLCLYYFQKSYRASDSVGNITYNGCIYYSDVRVTADYIKGYTFKGSMLRQPAVTLYSPVTGSSGHLAIASGGDVLATAQSITKNSYGYISGSGIATDKTLYIHWTAEAELE